MTLTPEQVEYSLHHHGWMSYNQAKLIRDMVEERFEPNAPERFEYREAWHAIVDKASFERVFESLKAVPTLEQKRRGAERVARGAAIEARQAEEQANRAAWQAEVPTEDGLYRNPETGELWRLARNRDGELIVSKYSQVGHARRLTTDHEIVKKGTWKRYTAFNSRLALSGYSREPEVKASWLIDAKELAQEYSYGFCPLHYGPLTDAVSVVLGYGKTCASRHGLPWSEEAARALLAEQGHGKRLEDVAVSNG